MKGKIAVERIYSLGDYKNIKLSEEITEIPEEYLEDKTLMRNLRYLQLVDMETSYRTYLLLKENLDNSQSAEELSKFLTEERNITFDAILKQLNKE